MTNLTAKLTELATSTYNDPEEAVREAEQEIKALFCKPAPKDEGCLERVDSEFYEVTQ